MDMLEGEQREELIRQLAATLSALPAFAPVYPCATGLSAVTPLDGSGALQLDFEVSEAPETVAAFYRNSLLGHGEIADSVDQGDGGFVHSISLVTPEGATWDVYVKTVDDRPGASVFILGEGLKV